MKIAKTDTTTVASWINDYTTMNGYPPSRREMQAKFGFGLSTAQKALDILVEEGLLTVTPGIPRGIRITKAGMKAITEKMV